MPESRVLVHAARLVGVDAGLPFALVLGDQHVGHKVDDVAADLLAALGKHVFEQVAHGVLAQRGPVQQRLDADLLGDDLRRARDGAQGERLLVGEAPVLGADGRIRRRAGAHDGEYQRLVAAGDRGVEKEVSHAHAGLVGKAADAAPFALHDVVDLAPDGAVDVAELVIGRVLVDGPVRKEIRRLPQVGKALERAFQHAERGGTDGMLLRLLPPVCLVCHTLPVV